MMKNPAAMTIKESGQPPKGHCVWVGEDDRIVSFHAVDTYQLQTFDRHDFFLNYLCALQERGFRFQ